MNNFKIIKKYFTITKANKKITCLLILTSLLTNGPYMFTSLLFSLTIHALTVHDVPLVLLTMSAYFILKITSKIFRIISYQVEKRLYNDVYEKLHHTMIAKLDVIDLQYFDSHSKAEILNIVNQDIKLLAEFGSWLSNAILLFLSFLVSLMILCKISIGLMLFGCLVNGLVIYILNTYNEKYERLTKKGKEKADEEMQFYNELLSGLYDIRIFNFPGRLHLKYQKLNQAYIDVHNQQINNQIISNIISPTITMCTEIILMIYACHYCLNGHFGIDTVLIIQSYFGTLFSSLSQFISILGELRIKNVSIERYRHFIQSKNNEHFLNQENLSVLDSTIRFQNINFAYEEKKVFENYSLQIPAHTLNALAGPSGAGKSTLFRLLLRFEEIQSGSIFIGQNSIDQYSKEQYAKIITCVSQQPYLFHMSIYDNFALINPDIHKIREACRKAEIDDFIMSLPMQYETMIEDGALNLSGGQKQRIAIARALLQESQILLLDEITSALDEKTSLEIFHTLTKLAHDHTILLISHKPYEYQQCQNIIHLGI